MAIDRAHLKATQFPELRQTYDEKDCIFYALSVGIGQNHLDPWELGFVYEGNVRPLPTMPVVLAYPGFWQQNPETGINAKGIVHGEQRLTLHRPLPSRATVLSRMQVDEVVDKGEGRGALLHSSRRLYDEDGGELLCTMSSTAFCRFDGGFSKEPPAASPVAPLEPVPERAPDQIFRFTTQPSIALIYRLNGDFNPLHADPDAARAGGFEQPILHGLCTYAIAAYSVMTMARDLQRSIKRFDVRFTSPVYPGETLITEVWREPGLSARLRCRTEERDVVVLDRGYAEWFADDPK